MTHDDQTDTLLPQDASTPAKDTPLAKAEKSGWVGPAVGVGSAALVAALLYARRRK